MTRCECEIHIPSDTIQPRGLFYTVEEVAGERVYVGIHNEDGSAWTEDFKSLTACKRWLKS